MIYNVCTWLFELDEAVVLSSHDTDAEAFKARCDYDAEGISSVIAEVCQGQENEIGIAAAVGITG